MATIVNDLPDTLSEAEPSSPLSQDESRILLDAAARRYLNITGDEFLRRWDAGYFKESYCDTRATRVAMLIPMVRPTVARKKSR